MIQSDQPLPVTRRCELIRSTASAPVRLVDPSGLETRGHPVMHASSV